MFTRTIVLVRNSVHVIVIVDVIIDVIIDVIVSVYIVLLNNILWLVIVVAHTLCFLMSSDLVSLLFIGLKTVTVLSAMVRIDIHVQFGTARLDLQTILSTALDKLLARWSIHDRKR